MNIHNKLIITLAVAFGIINILLAFLGQKDLSIYFIIDCIAYFIIVLTFINLNPGAKAVLNRLSAVLLVGFLAVLSIKVIDLLK